jgi:hypothetical protein
MSAYTPEFAARLRAHLLDQLREREQDLRRTLLNSTRWSKRSGDTLALLDTARELLELEGVR